MRKPIVRRIDKDKYEIIIIGNRDPRGSDNEIMVEVNEEDELIITIPKTRRCYGYEKTENTDNYVKIIAK